VKSAPIDSDPNHSPPKVSSPRLGQQLGLFPGCDEVRRKLSRPKPKWLVKATENLDLLMWRPKRPYSRGVNF